MRHGKIFLYFVIHSIAYKQDLVFGMSILELVNFWRLYVAIPLFSVPFILDSDLYFQFRDLVLNFVPQQGHHAVFHSRNI